MDLEKALKKYKCVVVTGGSSGIGRAFINLIMTINNPPRICNLSRTDPGDSLQKLGVIHYPCDMTDLAQVREILPKLLEQLHTTAGPVLLINNSGFGSYGRWPDLDLEHELSMIDLNVRAVVALTGELRPVFNRYGGGILNVASTAAWQPTPYMATYGATKSFLLSWGLALHEDLRVDGIVVTNLCPGPTESQFFRRAGFSEAPIGGLGETAETVARNGLIGLGKGRSLVVSGWKNQVLVGLGSRLPRRWQAPIAGFVLRKMRLEKKRAQSTKESS